MYKTGDTVKLLWDGLMSIDPGAIGIIRNVIDPTISSVPYEVTFGKTIVYLHGVDIEKVTKGGL